MTRTARHLPLALVLACALLAPGNVAQAAVLWVGSSAQCTGGSVYPSLNAAVLAAVSAGDDEIRLTSTLSYLGNGVVPTLSDWDPGTKGRLTIAGGFADCFSGQSGRTVLGTNSGILFKIETSSQPSSVVTLRDLELTSAGSRALTATGGAAVTLQNVWIHDNPSGIGVYGGNVTFQEDSIIEDSTAVNTSFGGGIDCFGAGSYVAIRGRLTRNVATSGGNLYSGGGCLAELYGGAVIEGFNDGANSASATNGGGVFVDNNGVLVGNGGASRITIRNLNAFNGGGLYIQGSGVAVLFNTLFYNNTARFQGGAIHATGGGTTGGPQLVMDRVADCPFGFSCSEIELNDLWGFGDREGVAIYASNSLIALNRTVLDLNGTNNAGDEVELVTLADGAILEIDSLGVSRNTVTRLFRLSDGAKMRAGYVTTVLNSYDSGGNPADPWAAVLETGSELDVRSSILNDMKGISATGGSTVDATCNLVDAITGMPAGSFFIGSADFLDAPVGGITQIASSPGVDMCNDDLFAHTGVVDITYRLRPFDEPTNANGSPGISGGIYDAGMNEVGGISGQLFADGFESGSTTAWSSTSP